MQVFSSDEEFNTIILETKKDNTKFKGGKEEEDFENDHPKLWKKFAIALGSDSKEIESIKQENFTIDMINNFFKQARSSFAEGLGSFYTYERQVPEIAVTKIKGLKKFYGIDSKDGLMFFEVHKEADILHRSECEKLLDTLNDKEKKLAEKAALTTAKFIKYNKLYKKQSRNNSRRNEKK